MPAIPPTVARSKRSYVGEDPIVLLADAALQGEGQVVAADNHATAEPLLERLHVRLDAREVQSLSKAETQTVIKHERSRH